MVYLILEISLGSGINGNTSANKISAIPINWEIKKKSPSNKDAAPIKKRAQGTISDLFALIG